MMPWAGGPDKERIKGRGASSENPLLELTPRLKGPDA